MHWREHWPEQGGGKVTDGSGGFLMAFDMRERKTEGDGTDEVLDKNELVTFGRDGFTGRGEST